LLQYEFEYCIINVPGNWINIGLIITRLHYSVFQKPDRYD